MHEPERELTPEQEERLDALTDQMIEAGRKAGEELAEATSAVPPIMRAAETLRVGHWIMLDRKTRDKRRVDHVQAFTDSDNLRVLLTRSEDDDAQEFYFKLTDEVEVTSPNIDKLLRNNIREALRRYV